jgi:ferritin
MEKALNRQVNAELYSAYLYQSMHAWFLGRSLDGFASWMQAQALEEVSHAMKIYHFVAERGGNLTLEAIDKPPSTWDAPVAVFKDVLAHERKVTGMINDLVNLAQEEKDHATNQFLQWFVEEQVEEESSADSVLQKIKLSGDKGNALFMMDKELGARVFVLPPNSGIQAAP